MILSNKDKIEILMNKIAFWWNLQIEKTLKGDP